MKKILAISALTVALFSGSASAGGDACGTVLCLGGMILGGDGGKECKTHIESYFSINKYKHGHFSPSKTLKARKSYLNQCDNDDKGDKERINAKWGMVEGNPI